MARILRIPEAGRLAVGLARFAETDGKTIALFNVEGDFLAIDNKCPHRSGRAAWGVSP